MAFDRFTIGERLEALACNAQELAAHAHYWAVTAREASQPNVAAAWQREHAHHARQAQEALERLQRSPASILELDIAEA
jgi:predicted glycosyl hydrolase (DUF1957 family)